MEGTTFDLREYKIEQDKLTKQAITLPDWWEGHARLAIRQSDAVPEHIEDKAIDKALAIADKNGVSPKMAANRLIKSLK